MTSSEHTDSSTFSGWHKSSYSGGSQGECLEIALGYADVPVRDSKAPHGPAVVVTADSWSAFVAAVRSDSLGS